MTTETAAPTVITTTTPAVAAAEAAHAAAGGAPTAAPAPAAAPVAAPVAAPAAAPAPAPSPAGNEGTGDPGLDLALDFVTSKGIGMDDPAMEAARDGDFSLLEAKLAALGDKAAGYDKFVALAKQAHASHTAKQSAANEAVAKMVHSVCGGEAGWAQVQAWASANATPEEKASINAAFAAGGLQAKAAAKYLADTFQRSGAYREPKPATKDGAGAGATESAPLTARAYSDAVSKLHAQARGRDISNTPEYRALQQARLVAKRAGY